MTNDDTIDPAWAALDAAGIDVRRDGDRLRFSTVGERGPITADELALLREHKAELLVWLGSPVGKVVSATAARAPDSDRRRELLERFDELCGTYEGDQGVPPAEAEEAAAVVLTDYYNTSREAA